MSVSDTSEKGLEALIEKSLLEEAGYLRGDYRDYDRAHCLDPVHLWAFLRATQPQILANLEQRHGERMEAKLVERISAQVRDRGVVDVLRKGITEGTEEIKLYYPKPATTQNPQATERHAANRFSVTRQLHFSEVDIGKSLDMVIILNGLPVATFELKNQLTTQNVEDAMRQYQRDRDPKEPLFKLGRCLVHFAVDDVLVYMTTHLQGEHTSFLPFNLGHNEGAGNPPNPEGLRTDYLWKRILTRESLAEIIEKYAQVVEETGEDKRKHRAVIFPRYHQLDLVRRLLADAQAHGAGRRYLIQHSAGSGKSKSIAWLAHQLVDLNQPDGTANVFDSIIVVTDRTVLDKQIRDQIKQFAHVAGVVEAVTEHSGQLKKALQDGKKVIVTTIQKFPYIVNDIQALSDKRFAVIIDEAHSSQSGQAAAKMNTALQRDEAAEEQKTLEEMIAEIIEKQQLARNASYFAFTATPKSKTLEAFGTRNPSTGKFAPFHTYTMKQAIEEGFILDVLSNYTTYESYYQLYKKVEDDPEFDSKRAQVRMRKYVERHPAAITQKARIMVDHFESEVYGKQKINGHAKAMVVTDSIQAAIEYRLAFDAYLREIKAPYEALVAFTGEQKVGGKAYTEERMNDFPSSRIPDEFKKDKYRFLIVAEKFQTGFDEPLLHTMYVDKPLSDVKAVQTLSRLNRAYHPWKKDTFVLDFRNTSDQIQLAFEPFYRTTILSDETDLNRLNDLQFALDKAQVYAEGDVLQLMTRYLNDAPRDQLDPILDPCVEAYRRLPTDEQIKFKQAAKSYVRAYEYLALIHTLKPAWESLKTFLKLLLPKLPTPDDEDLASGVLERVDMESYRAEQRETITIAVTGGQELEPTPAVPRGGIYTPQMEALSAIVREFNERFATDFTDADRVRQILEVDLPKAVHSDEEYQNAKRHSDRQNAKITHDQKVTERIQAIMLSDTELYRKFSDDERFRAWVFDKLFNMDYGRG